MFNSNWEYFLMFLYKCQIMIFQKSPFAHLCLFKILKYAVIFCYKPDWSYCSTQWSRWVLPVVHFAQDATLKMIIGQCPVLRNLKTRTWAFVKDFRGGSGIPSADLIFQELKAFFARRIEFMNYWFVYWLYKWRQLLKKILNAMESLFNYPFK